MKQRDITYISIQESRTFHSFMPKGNQMFLYYDACIQERVNGDIQVRGYKCSHWSIKRLAKIQEKLAK